MPNAKKRMFPMHIASRNWRTKPWEYCTKHFQSVNENGPVRRCTLQQWPVHISGLWKCDHPATGKKYSNLGEVGEHYGSFTRICISATGAVNMDVGDDFFRDELERQINQILNFTLTLRMGVTTTS